MKLRNRSNLIINITGTLLILLAASIKIFFYTDKFLNSVVRPLCYIIMFSLWIVSICWRVVQKQIRTCLLAIAGLEIFWMLIRWIKYELLESEITMRYAWYLYYLPTLMILAFCMVLPFLIGKPDSSRISSPLLIFPALSLLLFLLTVTNDLHGLVFVLSGEINGPERLDVGNYSYGAGFWIIAVYAGLCAFMSLGLIFFKCRVTNRKASQVAALFPFVACWAVCILNVMGVTHLFNAYRIDITAFVCVCVTATLEACIQNGLIRTNSGYEVLFRKSSISACITDKELLPVIFSDTYREISDESMQSAVNSGPVMLENGIRLSASAIKYGSILWQDDLSELNEAVNKCAEINEYLKDKNETIQKDIEYQKKERQLAEKNRLYNSILTQMKAKIEHYSDMLEQLSEETDPVKIRTLAVKISLISAFIKRRINIIFLDEENQNIDPAELYLSIEEILRCLRQNGAEYLCTMNMKNTLTFDKITHLYESFCDLIYRIMDDISLINIYLTEENSESVILLRVSSEADLHCIPEAYEEDGDWVVKIT